MKHSVPFAWGAASPHRILRLWSCGCTSSVVTIPESTLRREFEREFERLRLELAHRDYGDFDLDEEDLVPGPLRC